MRRKSTERTTREQGAQNGKLHSKGNNDDGQFGAGPAPGRNGRVGAGPAPRRKRTRQGENGAGCSPEAEKGAEEERSQLYDTPASEGREEPVCWLWLNRLPRATVALLQGVKGCGKSTWLRRIAAAVSGGPPLPGERRRKADCGAVLWYAGEESLMGRVLPGLRSAEAILDRCYLADTQGEQSLTLALPNDSTRLQARILARAARLVVIDPLFSFLDGTTDLYADSVAARRYVLSLIRVAKITGALILLSRNCTKDTHHGALAAGRGNGEIGNTARAVLHCQEIPDAPGLYGLGVASCNDGAPTATLTYRLALRGASPVINLVGETDLTPDDLAGGAEEATNRQVLEQAKALIRSMVVDGKLDSKVVKDKAERAMIGTRTLQTAARALGVRVQREGSREATVSYWLPPKGGYVC